MIADEDRKKFAEIQAQVECTKKFACVEAALTDLCKGRYYSDLDILECLEKTEPPCKFARPFGCTLVCTCLLRKFIARNFDQWSAEDTSLVRRPKPAP